MGPQSASAQPSSKHMDQLDERDKQAFLELQEKLVDQTNKKKQVSHSMLSHQGDTRYSDLSSCDLLTGSCATAVL